MKKVSGVFNELVEQRGYMSLPGPRVVYGLGCQKKETEEFESYLRLEIV